MCKKRLLLKVLTTVLCFNLMISSEVLAVGNTTSVKNIQSLDLHPARISLDIDANQVFTKTAVINGWTLNYSGIKKVNIYVDDTFNGAAKFGIARTDVDKAYPGYSGGKNSGFQYTVNTSKLSNGNHIIKVTAIGKDGASKSISTSIKVLNNSTYYKDYSITLSKFVDKEYALGAINYIDAGSWKKADKQQIAYYSNPNNFINNSGKYQFLKLNYTYGITIENLNSTLTNRGNLKNHSSAFLTAGKKYNISPLYLIAHSILETGSGQSKLAKGVIVTKVDGKAVIPRIVYNVYGVAAYDRDPIRLGAEFAYKHGWFSIDEAIIGGADFICSNFIRSEYYQQDTLYKMRWNPNNIYHQYATDIGWAYKQVDLLKALIDKCPNAVLIFEIPRFKK
ncbi:MAG: N-acetylglucosaminidase [Bacillota bacterium]|nr:N-acetylglucosaminidase [Bacillota bacterium]